jgi:hypothetical protein
MAPDKRAGRKVDLQSIRSIGPRGESHWEYHCTDAPETQSPRIRPRLVCCFADTRKSGNARRAQKHTSGARPFL